MTPVHNILALDDDTFFTRYAGRLVTDHGHHIVTCNNPCTLNLKDLFKFDIILLDIVMPGIDGISMLGKIREHAPNTNVILMTSLDNVLAERIAVFGAEIGVQVRGTLQKPFDRTELYRLLDNCTASISHFGNPDSANDEFCRDILNAAQLEKHEVWLQPQVSLATNNWVGCEAIPVLKQGQRQRVLPAEPIVDCKRISLPASFFTGLVSQGADRLLEIKRLTGKSLSLTVPVSALSLTDANFERTVLSIMDRHSIYPQQLVLELASHATENSHLLPRACRALGHIQRAGIRISATFTERDLGKTAELLSAAPFSELKLDRTLVTGLLSNASLANRVAALLVETGHRCIASIADGIEEADTLNWLCTHGCNIGQGNLISQPRDTRQLLDWHRDGIDRKRATSPHCD